MRQLKINILLTCFLFLSGCASYTPHPLSEQYIYKSLEAPNLVRVKRLHHLTIDLNKPLTAKKLAIMAVFTNADLSVLRAQQRVSKAQVFAAGLLPDPTFNLSFDHPYPFAGNTNAYGIGPDFDIGALFTHRLKVRAAQLNTLKVKDNLAWQEWLIANQVYLTVNKIINLQSQQKLLLKQVNSFKSYYAILQKEFRNHNIAILQFNEQKQTYHDLLSQLSDIDIQLTGYKIKLNHLLDMPPGHIFHLREQSVAIPKYFNNHKLFQYALTHRLDLKALKMAYHQQELKVQQAIAGQFPNIQFGFNKSRDTSNVKTFGINLSFSLPLWNRNQGNIMIERASRKELAVNYISRIQQVRSDIATLISHLLTLQKEKLKLTQLQKLVSLSQYKAQLKVGGIKLSTFLLLESDYYKTQLQLLQINQDILTNFSALRIATGKSF